MAQPTRNKQDLSQFVALVQEHGLPEVLRSIANLCDRKKFVAGKSNDWNTEAKMKLASATLGDLANDLEAALAPSSPVEK